MDDLSIPCGDPRLGRKFRPACQLSCCVTAAGRGDSSDESDDGYREQRRQEKLLASQRHKRPKSLPAPPERGAMELALGCTYPLPHAEAVKNEVADKLRHLEKLEIAIQGDDYADKEHQDTNHEALQYARAAASVLGCAWSFEEHVKCAREELALERLTKLPHVGPFRAKQIYELACTGTCEALQALCEDRCPLGSNGLRREVSEAGRAATLGVRGRLGCNPNVVRPQPWVLEAAARSVRGCNPKS